MAEKCRAALSREEVAIRDFYDIDHAVRNRGLDVRERALLGMIAQQLAVPGNAPVDVSQSRLEQLRLQLDAQLRPVLRSQAFAQFDLDRAFDIIQTIAKGLG